MDFLIDERLFKYIKPYGLGALACASVLGKFYSSVAFAYVYNKFSDNDEDDELDPNFLNGK